MTLKGVLRYLLFGTDEMFLPKSWLRNKDRIGNYVGYTRRQHQQGAVVTTPDQMQQRAVLEQRAAASRAFWAAVAAKQAKPKAAERQLRIVAKG